MKKPQNPSESLASPSPTEGHGGTPENRPLSTIWREIRSALTPILLAVGVTGSAIIYINHQLADIREDIQKDISEVHTIVNKNSLNIAIVKTEVKALRRDIERVEKIAKSTRQPEEVKPTNGKRSPEKRNIRPPV